MSSDADCIGHDYGTIEETVLEGVSYYSDEEVELRMEKLMEEYDALGEKGEDRELEALYIGKDYNVDELY